MNTWKKGNEDKEASLMIVIIVMFIATVSLLLYATYQVKLNTKRLEMLELKAKQNQEMIDSTLTIKR